MLPLETCRDAESYHATLAHETTHWTALESRLARDFGTKRFGSEGYAIDELVAELGAAFLCADLDLTLEPREDHAAYIANWLQVLKADNRAIFTAASHAQRAADFIEGVQPALRWLTTDRGSGAHRIRPIDILYVAAYSHAEYL
jgi:antirestriction protein ArdC